MLAASPIAPGSGVSNYWTRDDYLTSFLAGFGKVRVPTGEGEALKRALGRIPTLAFPELPALANAPEHWRALAVLHCELNQATNET